jgi:hypothetical protein
MRRQHTFVTYDDLIEARAKGELAACADKQGGQCCGINKEKRQ